MLRRIGAREQLPGVGEANPRVLSIGVDALIVKARRRSVGRPGREGTAAQKALSFSWESFGGSTS